MNFIKVNYNNYTVLTLLIIYKRLKKEFYLNPIILLLQQN